MHIRIFESSQLEGTSVGHLLYWRDGVVATGDGCFSSEEFHSTVALTAAHCPMAGGQGGGGCDTGSW